MPERSYQLDTTCRTCDKCGKEVEPRNNALFFEEHLIEVQGRSHLALIGAQSRHLLPVKEGGKVICAGSPSRAQYLEGQPRDARSSHYDPKLELESREAYRLLLEGVVASENPDSVEA